jgi:hypothetical protein
MHVLPFPDTNGDGKIDAAEFAAYQSKQQGAQSMPQPAPAIYGQIPSTMQQGPPQPTMQQAPSQPTMQQAPSQPTVQQAPPQPSMQQSPPQPAPKEPGVGNQLGNHLMNSAVGGFGFTMGAEAAHGLWNTMTGK